MKNKSMNGSIIFLFSLFGLVMATLSVKGYTQKIEPFLWLLFGLIVALVLSRNIAERLFFHALLIGLCWGIINGIVQSIFFEQYITNNPLLKNSFSKSTFIQPKFLPLLTGPLTGLVAGIVLGGLTLLFKKIF